MLHAVVSQSAVSILRVPFFFFGELASHVPSNNNARLQFIGELSGVEEGPLFIAFSAPHFCKHVIIYTHE